MTTIESEGGEPQEPTQGGSEPSRRLGLISLNLFLLISFGVWISYWTYTRTESWELVGGLLGLGGLFAWIAFLSNVVTDRTKTNLQAWFEEAVLARHWTWSCLLGLSAVLIALFATCGTIRLDSIQDPDDRTVRVEPVRDPDGASHVDLGVDILRGRTRLNLPVGTPWFGEQRYKVTVSGLPSLVVDARALRIVTIAVPAKFTERSVLLLRPTPQSAGDYEQNSQHLSIELNGISLAEVGDYVGQSIWIGCDAGTEIPEQVLLRWRLALLNDQKPDAALVRWTRPLAPAPDVELHPGDLVQLKVKNADGKVLTDFVARVRSSISDFPQEVVFK